MDGGRTLEEVRCMWMVVETLKEFDVVSHDEGGDSASSLCQGLLVVQVGNFYFASDVELR